MSIIDTILIAIDDKPGFTREELLSLNESWTTKKAAVFSAIARLVSRGFIQENKTGYKITPAGEQRINFYLSALAEFKNNRKKWYLILAEIPGSQKLGGEKFRYQLEKIGAGLAKKGVYIIYCADIQWIKNILDNVGLAIKINILEIRNPQNSSLREIVSRAWHWEKLNGEYRQFIKDTEYFIKQLKTLPQEIKRINAKKSVFELAKILSQDPKIPDEFVPTNFLRQKATKLYHRIQHFCY